MDERAVSGNHQGGRPSSSALIELVVMRVVQTLSYHRQLCRRLDVAADKGLVKSARNMAASTVLSLFGPHVMVSLYAHLRPNHGRSVISRARWQSELERLCEQNGIRTPSMIFLPISRMANAMAVGAGNHGSLLVFDGATKITDRRLIRAVLAHELAHLRGNHLVGLAPFGNGMAVSLAVRLLGAKGLRQRRLRLLTAIGMTMASALAQRSFEERADSDIVALGAECSDLAAALEQLEQINHPEGRAIAVGLPGRLIGLLVSHEATPSRAARLRAKDAARSS